MFHSDHVGVDTVCSCPRCLHDNALKEDNCFQGTDRNTDRNTDKSKCNFDFWPLGGAVSRERQTIKLVRSFGDSTLNLPLKTLNLWKRFCIKTI